MGIPPQPVIKDAFKLSMATLQSLIVLTKIEKHCTEFLELFSCTRSSNVKNVLNLYATKPDLVHGSNKVVKHESKFVWLISKFVCFDKNLSRLPKLPRGIWQGLSGLNEL